MVTTAIIKKDNGRIKEIIADDGIAKIIKAFSASDLADILISKGIISEEDIK